MCGFLVDTGSELSDQTLNMLAETIQHRGPDQSSALSVGHHRFFFHRLAIIDQSTQGQQPFSQAGVTLVCNGEIYNDPTLRVRYLEGEKPFAFQSDSDCEVLLPLYEEYGALEMVKQLDGEFAFVLYDEQQGVTFAARDPMGIRPLFYGRSADQKLLFASEAKALVPVCDEVLPAPPGLLYDSRKDEWIHYRTPWDVSEYLAGDLAEICGGIREGLVSAVEKRLRSDAPVGFLLSGGLDSSLVCAIAAELSDTPITTFSVGIVDGPIDTHYAREVAEHIGSIHHEYLFTEEELLAHLDELIYQLETWDITTVRASMGMSLLCRYIRRETGIKVVLTGEVSDELFGYKYTDYAPSAEAFQEEAVKRVKELYLYDVLRADRCISLHGLEARVPFSDTDFVERVMSIDPKVKMNTYGIGKYLLRHAFDGTGLLPHSILFREKAAFSDAVGHSMVDYLKAYAEASYNDEDLLAAKSQYPVNTPFTKESLLYREIFEKHFAGRAALIPDFWMPNRTWENCDVDDPSARALPNYGASGATPDEVESSLVESSVVEASIVDTTEVAPERA